MPGFTGRNDLGAFLLDPQRPWDGGPFSAAAHDLLAAHAAELARLTAGFDRLAAVTAPARADPVITHGEPHRDTPDTRQWLDSLVPGLERLDWWQDQLD